MSKLLVIKMTVNILATGNGVEMLTWKWNLLEMEVETWTSNVLLQCIKRSQGIVQPGKYRRSLIYLVGGSDLRHRISRILPSTIIFEQREI